MKAQTSKYSLVDGSLEDIKNQLTQPVIHSSILFICTPARYDIAKAKSRLRCIKHLNRGFPPQMAQGRPVSTVDRWACPGPRSLLRHPIMVEPGSDGA